MGNNTLNMQDDQRLKFGCATINKLARPALSGGTGRLVAGDLTPLTDIASLVTAFRAKQVAASCSPEERILWDGLIRECCWLNEIGKLTTAIITGLTSVRGTSAGTDLRFNFSSLVANDPNFDPALEEYTAFASGSTIY